MRYANIYVLLAAGGRTPMVFLKREDAQREAEMSEEYYGLPYTVEVDRLILDLGADHECVDLETVLDEKAP